MLTIKINKDNLLKTVNIQDIATQSHDQQIILFNQVDKLLLDINKKKYENSKEIIEFIKSARIPNLINKNKITLLALLNFFQKRFTLKPFYIDIDEKIENRNKLSHPSINIISKLNNFPHLIGISGLRDKTGKLISKSKPREFLDGVLYQWLLINSYEDYMLDLEKLEVFSWMTQTLSNPTYILTREAIRENNTKIKADLIFIRRIFSSNKYSFHIVCLKNESQNNYAFVSQFAIVTKRFYRIEKMFDLGKAIYNFYKNR